MKRIFLSITITCILLISACSINGNGEKKQSIKANSSEQIIESTATCILTESHVLFSNQETTVTSIHTATFSFPPTISATTTPIITATPLADDGKNEYELIEKIENNFPKLTDPKCTVDILRTTSIRYEKPIFSFNISTVNPFIEDYIIVQIADNSAHTYKAFIAHSNVKYCNEEQCTEKLYIRNEQTGEKKEIDWTTRSHFRPIGNIIWIGDSILVFMEQTGISVTRIGAVDLRNEILILFLENDNYCND